MPIYCLDTGRRPEQIAAIEARNGTGFPYAGAKMGRIAASVLLSRRVRVNVRHPMVFHYLFVLACFTARTDVLRIFEAG
jgi:hypothetical protein